MPFDKSQIDAYQNCRSQLGCLPIATVAEPDHLETTHTMSFTPGSMEVRCFAWAEHYASTCARGLLKVAALLAAVLLIHAPQNLWGQTNVDGAVSGRTSKAGTVMVENLDLGFKRTVTTSIDGRFHIGSLPPGHYKATYTDASGSTATQGVEIVLGATALLNFDDAVVKLNAFEVRTSNVNPIDFARPESVSIFTDQQIEILPVARDQMNVALLAPGTTRGDSGFGNLLSFGGASVAENVYYINGFNTSNFRNGMAPSTIPFEFYKDFEVLTGGYSAQYGRSDGGVISATSKSGGNQFQAGVNLYWQPDVLQAHNPDVYYVDTNNGNTVTPYAYNDLNYSDSKNADFFASGPILKNKFFYYALWNSRNNNGRGVGGGGTAYSISKDNNPFYSLKLDLIPVDGQHLEYTGFRNKVASKTVQYAYDFTTRTVGEYQTSVEGDRGGDTHIARYTGVFFENLSVSVMFGAGKTNLTNVSDADKQYAVYDGRSGPLIYRSGSLSTSKANDERRAMRIDISYTFSLLGEHDFRAGLDQENNRSNDLTSYSGPKGGAYYRYYAKSASFAYNGSAPLGTAQDVVRLRVYRNGGSFRTNSAASYGEDNWSLLNKRLVLRLGLRDEGFQNFNSAGGAFIHVANQWAPRLGATFDVFGDQKTKLAVNVGRYHLPVAANTNIRLAGGELYTETYYKLNPANPINADWTPNLGSQIGATNVYSDGAVADTSTIVARDIKPMYQDEVIISLQHDFGRRLSAGLRIVARSLKSVMDDMVVNDALTAYAARNHLPTPVFSSNHYVLGNPGSGMTTAWDFTGSGTPQTVYLTAADLGNPPPVRKYYAMELFAERIWDGKWSLQGSYTWAHNYGNDEGWVLSDNDQTDAGLTILYDSPTIMSNAYGNLANDIRHQFKLFGNYAIMRDIKLGFSALLRSGTPINKFGYSHDPLLDDNYDAHYLMAPRGSLGTMPWMFNLDFSLTYTTSHLTGFLKDRASISLAIFNILNRHTPLRYFDVVNQDASGTPEPRYGIPTAFQDPRSIRLSVALKY